MKPKRSQVSKNLLFKFFEFWYFVFIRAKEMSFSLNVGNSCWEFMWAILCFFLWHMAMAIKMFCSDGDLFFYYQKMNKCHLNNQVSRIKNSQQILNLFELYFWWYSVEIISINWTYILIFDSVIFWSLEITVAKLGT